MPLLQFLKQTSENQQALSEFKSNPEKAMQNAGLTDEEKNAIRTGDRAQIASLIETDAHAGAFLNVDVTVQIMLNVH